MIMVTFTLDVWLSHDFRWLGGTHLFESKQFETLAELLQYLTEKLGFLIVEEDIIIAREDRVLVTIKAFGLIGYADDWFEPLT